MMDASRCYVLSGKYLNRSFYRFTFARAYSIATSFTCRTRVRAIIALLECVHKAKKEKEKLVIVCLVAAQSLGMGCEFKQANKINL